MNAPLRFDDWDTPVSPPPTAFPPTDSGEPDCSPLESLLAHSPPQVPPALAPVAAADKRIVNGKADINQLAPFKYPWAWEFFLKANRNHWTPLEIPMAQDVHDYHHKLSPAERHVFENVLAYLTTSDILAMRNIGLAVMEKMSAPELQIYQARQVYEEALHTWTYQHCIENLGLDQQEIYNRYRVVPAIHAKIALANRRLERVLRSDLDLGDRANLHEFGLSYFFFAVVFEGCWFYNGFTPIFALQRRGLMKGAAEQLQYIMRRSPPLRLRHPGDPGTAQGRIDDPGPEGPAATVGRSRRRRRRLRPLHPAGTHPRLQRRPPHRPVPLHRQPPLPPARRPRTLSRRRKRPALAGRAGQPAKGEELLRDPGDGVSDRRGAGVGMSEARAARLTEPPLKLAN